MGTMAKEIKKLKGRDTFLAVQNDIDNFIKAKGYQAREDASITFLQQLHYGMDQLLQTVANQEMKIDQLLQNIATTSRSRSVKVRRHFPTQQKSLPYEDLAKALYTIENYKDGNGRILWRKARDPKELVFAYLRRAESEGIDINTTMKIQEIPTYRRVFQYVVYNIGAWKDIIDEYRESPIGTPKSQNLSV